MSANEKFNGHTFEVAGSLFRCFWVGDNSGYYVWRTDDASLRVRKHNRIYRAQVAGRTLATEFASLRDAMTAAARSVRSMAA